MLRRIRRGDESGFGLITVVAFSAILSGVVAVAFAMSTGSLRSSRLHVEFGRALDVAETGVDQTLARLQADYNAGDRYSFPDGLTVPDDLTAAEQDAWARTEIEALADDDPTLVQHAGQGDYLAIAPENRQVIYSMSWVPSRSNPSKVRVLKAEYLYSTYSPTYAVLSGGDLEFFGNIEVDGAVSANVHANGNMEIQGASNLVDGVVTSVGTYTNGGSTVGAGSQGGQLLIDIPSVNPRNAYSSQLDEFREVWWDLCPDGTVRRPPAEDEPKVPCTGEEVADATVTSTTGYRNWTQTTVDGVVRWQDGNDHRDGVYYAYHSDIDVDHNGSGWITTLLAEADESAGECAKSGGNIIYRNMSISAARIPGILLGAGQDLDTHSSFSLGEHGPGMLSAVDQVDHSTGSADIWGAILSENECDTPDSPIDTEGGTEPVSLQGIELTFSGGLESAIADVIRTTLWLEV